MEDAEHATEEELVLMFADLSVTGSNGAKPDRVAKDVVMQILEFIHLDCYGDFYEPHDPRHLAYQEYLGNRLRQFRDTLPDWLPVSRRK